MARAALGWTTGQLAARAGVLVMSVRHYSEGFTISPEEITKVRTALEYAGAVFLAEDGVGPGVRLRTIGPRIAKKPNFDFEHREREKPKAEKIASKAKGGRNLTLDEEL